MTAGLFDLSGKVAIVTGGNGGIGLGMARGLAQAGAAIAVVGRNQTKSKDAVAELTETPRYPRTISRPCFKSSINRRMCASVGIANPIPFTCFCGRITAVLMPITSPARLNSGPPEFPGLICAVV